MSIVIEYALSALLLIGGFFILVGAIGLVRLPDFYARLHAPTKATTLGVGAVILASVGYFSSTGAGLGVTEILITVFLFLTAPVSANFMAKAAMHLEEEPAEGTKGTPWEQ